MSSSEQLEQPLWELIYELLSPEEEAALLERITSEPELARAYAKVKLQSELAAAAARCDEAHGRLVSPSDPEWDENAAAVTDLEETDFDVMEFTATAKAAALDPRPRSRAFRVANWIVTAAALGLIVMSGVSLTQLRAPVTRTVTMADSATESQTAATHLRTVVTTPPVWNVEATNYISVRTASLDGVPAATSFEMTMYDPSGQVQLQETHRTDETGSAQVALAGSAAARATRLEIAAAEGVSPPITAPARWARSRHITHLTTDLPWYQPGDTVSYRSLSLSRFDQRVDGEVAVEFDVLDAKATPIADANYVTTSEQGVGAGTFDIPVDSTDGKLTILARSPDGKFPEQRRDIQVQKIDIPKWNKELALGRESYEPGDQVEGRLTVKSHDGEPAVGKRLEIAAFVDQQPVALDDSTALTDADGKYDVHFTLPPTIMRGDAVVTVNVADDQVREQLAKAIPIHTGRVDIQFYPEGGELAAGLRNQVYFRALDLRGEAIHLEGHIVDEAGNKVARAVTVHQGRGQFALNTQAGIAYRLIVDKPAAQKLELPLPTVSTEAVAVLHTGGQVLDPLAPLGVTLRMRNADRSLVVAAACRGSLVGLQAIEQSDFSQAADGTHECHRQLELADTASGVIRVTVYDSTQLPPAPIAERLVYRRPAKRWHVQFDPYELPRPGDQVMLGLQTVDEQGNAAAAALGIAVVDQAVLNVANDRSPNLETLVFLTSEIQNAAELEDANFFLGASEEAATAMDLLLGTQGWRRFVEADLDQVVQNETKGNLAANWALSDNYAFDDGATGAGADSLVPVVLDNRTAVEAAVAKGRTSLAVNAPAVSRQWIRTRESLLQRWGAVLLVGGVLVLVAVLGLAIGRSLGHRRIWVPSAVMASIAMVLGIFWIGSRVTPLGDVAYSPISLTVKPAATAGNRSSAAGSVREEYLQDNVGFSETDDALFGRTDGFSTASDLKALEQKDSAHFFHQGVSGTGEAPDQAESQRAAQAAPRFRSSGSQLQGGAGGGFPVDRDQHNEAETSGVELSESIQRSMGARQAKPTLPPVRSTPERADMEKELAPKSSLATPTPTRQALSTAPANIPAAPQPAAPKPAAPKPAAPKPAAPTPAAPTQEARPTQAPAPKEAPAPGLAPQEAPAPAPAEPAKAAAATAIAADKNQPKGQPFTAAQLEMKNKKTEEPSQVLPLLIQAETRKVEDLARRYRRVYSDSLGEKRDRVAPSTLLWKSLIITDADGRATVTFQLPTSEATYVLRVDAHGDGRIGSGETLIQVQQP